MNREFKKMIQSLESDGFNWDFFEDGAILEDVCENTISGRVINRLLSLGGSRAVGLATAFAARRSLACWFLYCTDTRPMEAADAIVQFWVNSQNAMLSNSWTTIVEPMEDGKPIVDCRYSDTSMASSAVAHAAKYARDQNLLDAITSLSHAYGAFDCSPVGSVYAFERWFVDYAIPIAMQGREMTDHEAFAHVDFEPPIQFRRTF